MKKRKPVQSGQKKPSRFSKWFRRGKSILFYSSLILVFYLFILHHQIISKFEGRRWNLPSRVYSEGVPLFENQVMGIQELKARLSHLHYQSVDMKPTEPGQYRQKQNRFEIFLHDFDYPHEKFKGHLIAFSIENFRVVDLRSKAKKKRGMIYLEPELIASIYDRHMEDRTFVPLEQIPEELVQGVILIEDERFYRHFGVDPVGLARAMFVNLTQGRIVQGGSTLTQQLVKNYFLHQRKTLLRKFNEMFMALIMEFKYSKAEIIEAYLNEVYFGQRGAASITGAGEAARFYFSKNVEQLKPHESALLAAIVKSPGLFSPFFQPQMAKSRRDLILARLIQKKIISKKQYDESVNASLPRRSVREKGSNAPYFIEFVKKQLEENYPREVLAAEGLRIFTTIDMFHQRAAEQAVGTWLDQLEHDREFIRNKAEAGQHLEAALVALKPGTGFVQAYVGGRDFSRNQFDHVSQARRQPGSTFKPFVFAAALDPIAGGGFTLATLIPDHPVSFATHEGSWSPKNYDRVFHGNVRLRVALEQSYNVATAWLASETGLDKVVRLAKQAGIEADLKPYPSLALGSFEVTPIELAQAYTVFAGQGVRSRAVAIRRVVTKEGKVLEKKSFETGRILSRDVASLMSRLMQGVLDNGTARSARSRGFYQLAAGKTGTTSHYRDAWFVGYTPDHLALVWTGYDNNDVTNLSGASGALPIWADYMKAVSEGRAHAEFQDGDNLIRVMIDKETGLLYDGNCLEAYDEYFIKGTEPSVYCDR